MTAAAAEPKYVSRLALQGNPFSATVTEDGLYLGPEIKQRRDLVLHLLRASDKIPLLYGSNGLGKTTMLKALSHQGGDDLRFCYIQAEPSLTVQFLVSRCLQVFGAPQESTLGSNNLQLLQQRLQQLQKLQIRPVLLIDDVSKLAEPLRQQLKVWFDWQQEEKYLWRAVMTDVADNALVTENGRIQSLMLSAIPAQETAAYLMQRLQGVGYVGDSPFDDKSLIRFHRLSDGFPARLNQLAHQYLLGQGNSKPLLAGFKLPSIRFKWKKWYGLIPLAMLLALILFYQQQINSWFISDQPIIEEDKLNDDALHDELPMVVVDDPEPLTSVAEADRQELEELLEELEQSINAPESTSPIEDESTVTDATAESSPVLSEAIEDVELPLMSDLPVPPSLEEASSDVIAEPSEQSKEVDVNQGETAQEPPVADVMPEPNELTLEENNTELEETPDNAKSAITEPNEPEAEEPIPSSEPASNINESLADTTLKDKDWIMQQSATAFTFQLMGTWDRAEVDSFVKKHSLTGNMAVFASMRDGKVWYALIYGVYPSKAVAQRSSKQWSSPLNKVSPWLRRFDDVQKQIIDKAPDA